MRDEMDETSIERRGRRADCDHDDVLTLNPAFRERAPRRCLWVLGLGCMTWRVGTLWRGI
jgi:hypothetical protein